MDKSTLQLWSLDLYIAGANWELESDSVTIQEWENLEAEKDQMDGVHFRLMTGYGTVIKELRIERKSNLSNMDF